MLHANLMAISFIEPELWAIEVYIERLGILDVFVHCNLDSMTFIYEPDPYRLEIYRMCEYELPTTRLSRVIESRLTYIYTDRQSRPK